MGAELAAAMDKVKQVLNHYKAFKDIEAALAVAAASERMVVDFNLQAEALRKEIAGLSTDKVNLELAISNQAEAASLASAAANAELDKILEAKKAEIAEAEGRITVLKADAEALTGKFSTKRQEAEERFSIILADESAALHRLSAIEAKIAELKRL